MLPVVLSTTTKVGLAGAGDSFARRRAWLGESGIDPVLIADGATLGPLQFLFVAGLSRALSEQLAGRARATGVLVNVEDVPEFCDFHVPATVRRGDLLLTVSTGGKAPGLARIVREWLDNRFGPEWSYRLDHLAHARGIWRNEGRTPSAIAQRTRDFVQERRWL